MTNQSDTGMLMLVVIGPKTIRMIRVYGEMTVKEACARSNRYGAIFAKAVQMLESQDEDSHGFVGYLVLVPPETVLEAVVIERFDIADPDKHIVTEGGTHPLPKGTNAFIEQHPETQHELGPGKPPDGLFRGEQDVWKQYEHLRREQSDPRVEVQASTLLQFLLNTAMARSEGAEYKKLYEDATRPGVVKRLYRKLFGGGE